MDFISNLLFVPSVAQSIIVLSLIVTVGLALNRIKIKGISLGVSWILFAGIFIGHLGIEIDPTVLIFVREFGMIIFIYAIGMLVGPNFFSSFKQGGVQLNLLATLAVVLGLVVVFVLYETTGLSISTLMGIFSGAVSNTPGLGAAQETYFNMTGSPAPSDMGVGYALAYPVAILCMLVTLLAMKWIFKINVRDEEQRIEHERSMQRIDAEPYSLVVANPSIFGKDLYELTHILDDRDVVVSRILHKETGELEFATSSSKLYEGDKILVVAKERDIATISAFIGPEIEMNDADWTKLDNKLVSHRCLVSHPSVVGKTISQLRLRSLYHVNISRVYRAGLRLVAEPDLALEVGDMVVIVGLEEHVEAVERLLGNSQSDLDKPNLLVIFLGLLLGVLVGSIPLMISGIPIPVKLGLAGGTLIVAILISNFGSRLRINTHNTQSANLLMRDAGISLFLACVGLGAGANFVDTLVNGGYMWLLYAALMTLIPLWVALVIGRKVLHLDYFTMIGFVGGSLTFAAALSLSPDASRNGVASVRYATVYPLVMFLRVITAQWMIMLLL
ncbi:MAG: putative transporter [Porphyromonas sp.]|nr:putative transporter [Porphyromonas sp.]